MIFTIAAFTALMALGVGAATVAAIFAVVRLIERLDAEGRGRDPGDEDDGGGGVGPGPAGDPPWWPDFERELTAYVAGAQLAERRAQEASVQSSRSSRTTVAGSALPASATAETTTVATMGPAKCTRSTLHFDRRFVGARGAAHAATPRVVRDPPAPAGQRRFGEPHRWVAWDAAVARRRLGIAGRRTQ